MHQDTVTQLLHDYGSPLYVYDAAVIRDRYRQLRESITYPSTMIHYACKANTNPAILELLHKEGSSIECVSIGEIEAAFEAGFSADQIIFSCSNLATSELSWLAQHNIPINLDSLSQLERWGQCKPGSQVSLRINQDIGAGHHNHVITGGPDSKFGIHFTQLPEALALAARHNLAVIGLHQHIGSNILDEIIFMAAMEKILETAAQVPGLEFIDIGGGFGVPYRPKEQPLNMPRLGQIMSQRFENFCAEYGAQLTLRIETGRFLVAEAGTLLVTVTEIKKTPDHIFVGVDSGFNHLIRPAMYDAYHPIDNVSRPNGLIATVWVAGNICESGDIFARDRELAMPHEGDVLAIHNAGAYGYSMSSTYNSRPRPAEVLVEGDTIRLVRERGQ